MYASFIAWNLALKFIFKDSLFECICYLFWMFFFVSLLLGFDYDFLPHILTFTFIANQLAPMSIFLSYKRTRNTHTANDCVKNDFDEWKLKCSICLARAAW